jgi:4-amino-4-deoxy-L-arabinose transferase-like glycosyltransferase
MSFPLKKATTQKCMHKVAVFPPDTSMHTRSKSLISPRLMFLDTNKLNSYLNTRTTIVFLVLLAAVIRLSLISSAHFFGDEALFYHVISQIREGAAFPLLGPAVTGGVAKHPGPLFFYLMSLSQFFSKTPEAANVEVALLGALTVGFFFSAMKDMFGAFAAFISSVMMACAPWSILYADRIWNSNTVIFFVTVALWSAVKVVKKPDSRWIALFLLSCAVMPQFHLSVPVAWVGLVVLILPVWKKWNWKWIGAGLVLTLLAYAPYLSYEFQSGFSNLKALLSENSGAGVHQRYKIFLYAFRFFTLDVSYFQLSGSLGGMSEPLSLKTALLGSYEQPFHWWRLLALLSSFVLSGWIYISAFRGRKYLGAFWTAFVAAMTAEFILITITSKPFFPHYLVTILPFFFALIAALAQRMQDSPTARKWAIPLIVIFCVGGVEASVSVSRSVEAKNGLAVQRQVIEMITHDEMTEHWPERTNVGLELGFTGFLAGYSILSQDVYHGDIRIGPIMENGPRYSLWESGPFTEHLDQSRIRPVDSGRLSLYRWK